MRDINIIHEEICIWLQKDKDYGHNINIDYMLKDLESELQEQGWNFCPAMWELCGHTMHPCQECIDCIGYE